MNPKVKAALASYGRSFLVAVAVAFSAGQTEPKELLIAGLIAILGPGLRAINPKDPSFGVIADEVSKLLKAEKAK